MPKKFYIGCNLTPEQHERFELVRASESRRSYVTLSKNALAVKAIELGLQIMSLQPEKKEKAAR